MRWGHGFIMGVGALGPSRIGGGSFLLGTQTKYRTGGLRVLTSELGALILSRSGGRPAQTFLQCDLPTNLKGRPPVISMPTRARRNLERRQRPPDQRQSSHRRGYGARWQRIRAAHLSREPLCRECSRVGIIEPATDVDHIVPLAMGGTNAADNLQSLCHRHHSMKTARQSSGWTSTTNDG